MTLTINLFDDPNFYYPFGSDGVTNEHIKLILVTAKCDKRKAIDISLNILIHRHFDY